MKIKDLETKIVIFITVTGWIIIWYALFTTYGQSKPF